MALLSMASIDSFTQSLTMVTSPSDLDPTLRASTLPLLSFFLAQVPSVACVFTHKVSQPTPRRRHGFLCFVWRALEERRLYEDYARIL